LRTKQTSITQLAQLIKWWNWPKTTVLGAVVVLDEAKPIATVLVQF